MEVAVASGNGCSHRDRMMEQNAEDDVKGCVHNASLSPTYVDTHICISISICQYVVFYFHFISEEHETQRG